MKKLFTSKTKETEEQIELYLDMVAKALLIFNEGVKDFFRDRLERFEERRLEISNLEREGDDLLGIIKYNLYAYTLIPNSRADVLQLLDNMDDIVDTTKQVLLQIAIEKPDIPEFLREDFLEMTEVSAKAVDELVKAVRAFFRETKMVGNYVNKVYFYEKEADKIEERTKRKTFDCLDITSLSKKMHIRYFAGKIALLSDRAEAIAKNLMIYSAKREI